MNLMTLKEETERIVKWIYETTCHAKKESCIIGISSELESAVVLNLCTLAFPEKTKAFYISAEQNDKEYENASLICEAASVYRSELRIKQEDIIEKTLHGNYYSRLKMAKLYLFAEQHNGIVVGTKNKEREFTGFFTKYGDGGTDIEPISHLFRSEVCELAKYLGVPKKVINETSKYMGEVALGVGISYEEAEKAIRWIEIIKDLSGWHERIRSCEDKDVQKVYTMYLQSQHMRNLPRSI